MLAGCGGKGTPVVYRNISGELRGYEPPRLAFEVFKKPSQFAKYLRHVVPGGHVKVPPIDWAHRKAILVASGPRSSTGYTLHVVSLYSRGGKLVLTVKERTPSLGQPVTARLTYPYLLLTVSRATNPVVLHFRGRP